MEQNQFEFKPFDKVLVRDCNQDEWKVGIYSHYKINASFPHICVGSEYKQCIPYNDQTEHLIGTANDYKSKQKEIKYEVTFGFGKDLTVESFNEMEFKRFIGTAVCHNKDVKDFTVNMIIPD